MSKGQSSLLLYAAVLCTAATLSANLVRAQDGASSTVWDGVYTEAQSVRGDKVYQDQCSMCHGAEMKAGAGAPSLAGPEFSFGWKKKSLGELFEFIQQNMPPGNIGGLKDEEYTDILAAILQRNGIPASGAAELPTARAALDKITFLADKP